MLQFNTAYLCSVNAWLKILEIIFGLVCLLLLVAMGGMSHSARFLEMTAFCFLTMTLLTILSCICSATSQALFSTLFYINYCVVAFIFYLAGAIALFVEGGGGDRGMGIGAGVMGIAGAAVYLIDSILTCKDNGCCGGGGYA